MKAPSPGLKGWGDMLMFEGLCNNNATSTSVAEHEEVNAHCRDRYFLQ
jgi:hypothetical protein